MRSWVMKTGPQSRQGSPRAGRPPAGSTRPWLIEARHDAWRARDAPAGLSIRPNVHILRSSSCMVADGGRRPPNDGQPDHRGFLDRGDAAAGHAGGVGGTGRLRPMCSAIPPMSRACRARDGLTLHPSDNRMEAANAPGDALRLAAGKGRSVVMVSSGDPGVFAMAAAVFEALEASPPMAEPLDPRAARRVTAMLAAAGARGARRSDMIFCAINLSDNLKAVASHRKSACRLAAEADFCHSRSTIRVPASRPEGFCPGRWKY